MRGPYSQLALPIVCVLLALACFFVYTAVAVKLTEHVTWTLLVLGGACLGGGVVTGLEAQNRDLELKKEITRHARQYVDKDLFGGWRKY